MADRWEVVVVGGGSAGLAAAISAARAGAATLLMERHGFLGGMATAALVHTVCGLYRLSGEPGAAYANRGFPREFAERLIASGAAPGPVRMGRLDVLPHHPAGFMAVADEIAGAEEHLTIQLHTELVNVEGDADGWRLEWVCRGRRGVVECAVLLDASGDGVAAALGGIKVEQTPEKLLQRPAYVFGLGGVPDGWLNDAGRMRLAHAIVDGVGRGKLPPDAMGAHFRESGRRGEAFCTLDMAGEYDGRPYDPTDPYCLTQLERRGRSVATGLAACFSQAVPGLADCFVAQFPAQAGVRESRRVSARHMLRGEEILAGAAFDDGIAFATWPMEIRERATGPKWKYPEGNAMPQIPLRSLQVPEFDHFFVAGRCLGATHEAQAAIRVMGTCMATGEAAGLAAALRAGLNPVSAARIEALREQVMR